MIIHPILEWHKRTVIRIDSDIFLGAALVKFDPIQGPVLVYQKSKQDKIESTIEELLTQDNLIKLYITASTSLSPRSIYFDDFIVVISRCGLSILFFFLDRRTSDNQVMKYWRKARILTGKHSKKGHKEVLTPKLISTLNRHFQVAAH
ncbi:MAG: hypothetical protein ACFFCW_28470 [Candidatus Hodarchaeota archaeon]